ncbi:MAG: cation transporter [Acidimicrobiales bacterium]
MTRRPSRASARYQCRKYCRLVLVALILISAFLIFEVAAVFGRSFVLFVDAEHMLTDVGALILSAWAIRLAKRPAGGRWIFGLQRTRIISAAIDEVAPTGISLLIGVEAIQRLIPLTTFAEASCSASS